MMVQIVFAFSQFIIHGLKASFLILAVVLLRGVLKGIPKWVRCLLWGIVAVYLICPVRLASPVSADGIIEKVNPVRVQYENQAGSPQMSFSVPAARTEADRQVVTPQVQTPSKQNSGISMSVVFWAWLAGVAGLLIYAGISYFRLRRSVEAAVPMGDDIWICDEIASPFLLGIVRPRIYVPSDLKESDMDYVISHERAHLKRGDHLWKPLGYLLLCLYWYNPLVWVAYILLCRDIELACDEKAIADMSMEDKKGYSRALLACHQGRRLVMACPLAFGEVGVKERVRSVLHYKKPKFWVIVTAVAICVIVGVCFLTKADSRAAGENTAENATVNSNAGDGKANHQDTANAEEVSADEDKIREKLSVWAQAFCDRKGSRILAMCNAAAESNLREEMLLDGEGDEVSFGWSSPWPWLEGQSWVINEVDVNTHTATILYFAIISDPHVTVWEENLSFEWKEDTLQITGEELHIHDNIESLAEFVAAYPVDITASPMDYLTNGLLDALTEHADYLYNGALYEPVAATRVLLNLSDKAELSIAEETDKECSVQIHFPGEETDIVVRVVHVGNVGHGESWIPQEVVTFTHASDSVSRTSETVVPMEGEDTQEFTEVGDLDGNGVPEMIGIMNGTGAGEDRAQIAFYLNGEKIYEYEDLLWAFPGDAWWLDLNRDGREEIVFTIYPMVNSMPLTEYTVLTREGNHWKALEIPLGETVLDNAFPITIKASGNPQEILITCEGCGDMIWYNYKGHYQKLAEEPESYMGTIAQQILNTEFSAGEDFGSVAAWGVWQLAPGHYGQEGIPCLVATHGIEGPEGKFDALGNLDVYFHWDKTGKLEILGIQFYSEEDLLASAKMFVSSDAQLEYQRSAE